MNKFETLKHSLDLRVDPIGVKLIYDYNKNQEEISQFKEIEKRGGYCDYVKRASRGEFLKIKHGNFSCETANLVFGFTKLQNIELNMSLDMKGLEYILLFPINEYHLNSFDSIILIVNPYNCMRIIEAYVNIYGKPLKITCGATTGVCSEVTAHVIKREEVNFSFLCQNSRRKAIFDDCDLLCGIPAKMTNELIDEIIRITKKKELEIIPKTLYC